MEGGAFDEGAWAHTATFVCEPYGQHFEDTNIPPCEHHAAQAEPPPDQGYCGAERRRDRLVARAVVMHCMHVCVEDEQTSRARVHERQWASRVIRAGKGASARARYQPRVTTNHVNFSSGHGATWPAVQMCASLLKSSCCVGVAGADMGAMLRWR